MTGKKRPSRRVGFGDVATTGGKAAEIDKEYERYYKSHCNGGERSRLEDCYTCKYKARCYRTGANLHRSAATTEPKPPQIKSDDKGLWSHD